MSSDVLEQMRTAFKAEALDLLIELDSSLLALEEKSGDPALVHRVFRAIHTLKGSGGTAGFKHLARFTHTVEEVFDLARGGHLAVTAELVDCGLKACDVIRLILGETADATVAGEEDVVRALSQLLPGAAEYPAWKPGAAAAAPLGQSAPPGGATRQAAYEIVLKPKRRIFYSGADPVTLLDGLRSLGQAHITAQMEQVPALRSLDPEQCYLWWKILLVTGAGLAAIRDVFVFVEEECELSVQLLEDQAGAVAILGSVPPESLQLFKAECEDLLQQIENEALSLEKRPASKDSLDALFRGVHSLKGNAGVLLGQVEAPLPEDHPLPLLHRASHGLESLLHPFRGADAPPVPARTVQTALETCDAIRTLFGSLAQNAAGSLASLKLLERLGARGDRSETPDTVRSAAFLNTTSQCVETIARCFHRLEMGNEEKGPVLETYRRSVRTLSAAAQYQKCPELEAPLAEQLQILDAAIRSGAPLARAERTSLDKAFRSVCSILDRLDPAGSSPMTSDPSNAPQKAPADERHPVSTSTIRIDQEKLDRLMRVVGELLVARGAFPLLVQKLNEGSDAAGVARDLKEAGAAISRISGELQTSVMSIRMLPVKTAFQKIPRLVRDLARSLGKEVRLVIEGEGIELDKTILEQIGDPLVHVIRNSVDHGLETPPERLAAGKDPSGQVTLRAAHEAGGVVIEVADDGRGLDAAALKRKAVENRLVTEEAAAAMSEEAAFQLIFLPGLSTAAKVTDVSGRGVGMDVVRSNIRNLQGTVEIRSRRGFGTALRIKLPTSLMISKGILLEAGGEEYILPLSNICDMVKMPRAEAHQYRDLKLAQVRGRIYPIFSLADLLGLTPSREPDLSIAIVEAGASKYGLSVDRFVTELEVLVKPLTGGLEKCKEFQGAAIMGDGRVVLVLNALECHCLEQTHAAR